MELIVLVAIKTGEESRRQAAAQVLEVVQAVAADVAKCADLLAFVQRAMRLAGVLDYKQLVFFGDCEDRVLIGRHALDIHGDNDLGAFRDGRFQLGRVHAISPGIDINENRNGVLVDGARSGGQEGKSRRNNLVARPHAAGRQGHVQCRRATAGGQAVFGARIGRPFRFQGFDLRRGAAGHDAAVKHLLDQAPIIPGDNGPILVIGPLQFRLSPVNDRKSYFRNGNSFLQLKRRKG